MKASKRCPALSPGAHLQCELKKGHIKRDYRVGILTPRHRIMNIAWSDEEGATAIYQNNPEATAVYQNNSEAITVPRQNGKASAMGLKDGTIQVKFNGEDLSDVVRDIHFRIDPKDDLTPLDSEHELRSWWFNKANDEIELTVPKAIEYGSTDLIDIGVMLARTMRRTVTGEEAAELGVFFYLIGKIARWQSAIERGERPSDDTLLDIGVYVRMAQRIRDAGGWPGTKDQSADRQPEFHTFCMPESPCSTNCTAEKTYPNRSGG